jgi:hypothetical protein
MATFVLDTKVILPTEMFGKVSSVNEICFILFVSPSLVVSKYSVLERFVFEVSVD